MILYVVERRADLRLPRGAANRITNDPEEWVLLVLDTLEIGRT